MRQFVSFVKKEFYHILRDKRTLFILLGMPIVQIIIFGFALTNEVKHARFAVLDQSKDAATAELVSTLDASRYFDFYKSISNHQEIERLFRRGEVKIVLIFPPGFNESLKHMNMAEVQIIADAADPNT